MNDLDFDELDKAVSSLSNKTKATEETSSTSEVVETPSAVSTTASTKDASAQSTTIPVSTPAKRARLADAPPSLPSAASNKKTFIDIVSPKRQSTTNMPPRTATTIKPLASATSGLASSSTQSEQPPTEKEKPVASATFSPPAVAHSSWPDPLDFHNFGQEDEDKTETKPTPKPPAESPFLPDANVPKRPLGAFTDKVKSEKPAVAAATSIPKAAEPVQTSTNPQLPDELQEDILAVESDAYHVTDNTTPATPITQPQATSSSTPSANDSELHHTAMMSIPQQYQTAQKTVDNTPRPIFDTKEYHPPLIEATTHHGRGTAMKIFLVLFGLTIVAVAGYVIAVSL